MGHEMLNEFNLINMNGRVYDPVLGRFLSPDKYVQEGDNSQNYNSYSYCLNNPLKYADPSGDVFVLDDFFAITAMGAMMGVMNAAMSDKPIWKGALLGAASAAATYGIGSIFNGVGTFGHELLRAGAHGLSSGVFNALNGDNFWNGLISGAASSGIGSYAQSINLNSGLMVASTTAMGEIVAWATGGDFLQGAMQGMTIGLFNHAMHNENINGENDYSEYSDYFLSGGPKKRVVKLKEVVVLGKNNAPHEKPLEPVYPEFYILFSGRAIANGVAGMIKSGLGLFHEFSKLQNRTVQFGNNPNQVHHTFRHVDDMGLNRNMVRSSVINDLKRISNIPVGKPVNRIINVSGDKLQYTVFKRLENGEYIYNIGRIHGI